MHTSLEIQIADPDLQKTAQRLYGELLKIEGREDALTFLQLLGKVNGNIAQIRGAIIHMFRQIPHVRLQAIARENPLAMRALRTLDYFDAMTVTGVEML